MKRWLFLASLFIGTTVYAQADTTAVTTVDNSAMKNEIKKELVKEISSVVTDLKAAQKKESEELKFQIKELDEKLKKEIEISEKQNLVKEEKKEAFLNIKGITFLRSRHEFTNTEKGESVKETFDHYFLAMARVDFEKQVSNEVKTNLRIATDGSANLVKLGGDEKGNGTNTHPNIVVDHAYMTVDAGLTTNKVGMIYQKRSAVKDNYFAVIGKSASKGSSDGAYIDAGGGYYADDMRGTLVGFRSEIAFDKQFGLNLSVSKHLETATDTDDDDKAIYPDVTVNDKEVSQGRDLYSFIAEFPMEFNGIKFIPEGIIGMEDSISNISAGMDIMFPTSFAKFSLIGAGNFTRGDDGAKNGLIGVSAKIPLIKTKDVQFTPYVSYRASGETLTSFDSENLLIQHYVDFRFKTTYKKFSIRPRYRIFTRPNADVTATDAGTGGTDYTKQRFECDFMVAF